MTKDAVRLAIWSGPRNISTALMRAWGNRPDTFACDEPLYAHYLQASGKGHPGAAEIIAAGEADWRKVVNWLTGPVPEEKAIFFQKHMAHHLLPNIERGWLHRVTNCFLIRDPREMLTSLLKVIPEPKLEDTGLPQQLEVFRLVREHTGSVPPVLDARDVQERPRQILQQLCDHVDVEFTDAMLAWPAGPRQTDGVWAKHWYSEVQTSTSFRPYRPKSDQFPKKLEALYRECLDYHGELYRYRIVCKH